MSAKNVYLFGGKKADGNSKMKNLLGGKGANLAEMAKLGLPVPAGFTISTEVCDAYYQNKGKYPASLKKEVNDAVKFVEKQMGCTFGDIRNPLLLSCRSGARASMPGMMETVLNIGLNDQTVEGLAHMSRNPRFAYDSYRRFVAMYGDVVLGFKAESELSENPFDKTIDTLKKEKGYKADADMTTEDLKWLVTTFKQMIRDRFNVEFPENPRDQLWGAIGAVFSSWMIPRAVSYRRIHNLPDSWGTAVNVQAMVFGNMGDSSATGVAFSRNPATGENYFYGEYLINAQGEDVVAGIRTPSPINRAKALPPGCSATLADEMPKIYNELDRFRISLERHYRDMQDIEFTIQQDKLWMLQCRNGKRTAQAAIKIAVDLVKEKLITVDEALTRVVPEQLNQLLLPSFDPEARGQVIGGGLPASPGAAVGQVVFSASEVVKWVADGHKTILVRMETSPEDINGMHQAEGILTAQGGMTSHAAVVARGMGKTCVAGAHDLRINYELKEFTTSSGHTVKEGDWISLDGSKGEVILGKMPTVEASLTGDFSTFMKWAGEKKTCVVRTNADTPHDAQVARELGAEGIGLCRTEHMFFKDDRIHVMREMILAEDVEGRQKALDKLLPMQRDDFYGIFKAMNGFPVTIRTLDPPLHEFLPHSEEELRLISQNTGISVENVRQKVTSLKEQNPMLGHRGCRLGIVYPEITAMQARAIFEAAAKALNEKIKVLPEIMIPLVGHEKEFAMQKEVVDKTAAAVMAETKTKIKYLVGTMIELPRACLAADKIAEAGAQFFSFGTNDLTQTTFGLSRDDSGKFLPEYIAKGIWEQDPFATLDQSGVGHLMKYAFEKGRLVTPDLEMGICGEHGGDPQTVHFCCELGLNYVSCSPFRVPLARLAAAQAAIAKLDLPSSLSSKGSGIKSKSKIAPKAEVKNVSESSKKSAKATTASRKPASTAKKTATTKPAVPAKKTTTAKKVTAVKPAAPAKKVATVKKTVAAKPAATVKKATPAKKVAPVKKANATKPAATMKKVAPVKKANAAKPAATMKKAAPVKKATGSKPAATIKKAAPVKKANAAKPAATMKKAAPVKKVTGSKPAATMKKAAPVKKAVPVKKATGSKPAPAKKTAIKKPSTK